MRVSAKVKEQTGKAIRRAAGRLFARQGFAATTTREIAAAAGIATGTLFNYYETKEALALELVADALEGDGEEASDDAASGASVAPTLEESLFVLIVRDLRALEGLRAVVGQVLEAGLSPFAAGAAAGARVRAAHLERVGAAMAARGMADPGPVAMHLYWTLYVGVLAFWAADASPKQEDTLSVVDQATRMFARSLAHEGGSGGSEQRSDT